MKRLLPTTLALIIIAAASAHAQNNKMTYTLADCDEDGKLQTITEVWDALPDTEERLSCRMGIGCDGKAWTTCGTLRTPNEVIKTLSDVYESAAAGDSIRNAISDVTDHITQFVTLDTAVHVRADRIAYYKVYHLGTGALIFDDPRLARPGVMVAVRTVGTTPGPHLLLAYEPQGEKVIGYRLFIR